jgi:UDP-glucose:(heptosyl)LPS alpha-1,3-glucosyltransferase
MRKIYFIREKRSHHGGAEIYLSRLIEQFKKKNIDYGTIYSFFPGFLPSWVRLVLFNLQLLIFKGDKFYFSLERIICPDVYRAGDGVHRAFLKIENKSKLNPLHMTLFFIEKKCFHKSKLIIANSKMVKLDIVQTYGINPNKIKIIYNGFNPIEGISFKNSISKLAKEFNINSNQSIILYVGSGYKRKGVTELLQILSQLNNKNFIAFIIGKEKKHKDYEKVINAFSLGDRVKMLGIRKDVCDFYVASDIFILPSHYEPFGNAVLEAMSYGNVVITTKQTGASELLNNDFIMETPKDYSIVKKLDHFLTNPGLMIEEKQRNIKISKQYTIDRNQIETLEAIESTIND